MTSLDSEIIVSVFMITYNHEKYIAEALDSILMQEVDFRYEIVVGEDCSTDKTRQILLYYAEKYPVKIKLRLHDKNIGIIDNVIDTLKACTGKYIAFCEGDDFWTDTKKLQIQLDSMSDNPECYMSFHPSKELLNDDIGKTIAKYSKNHTIFTTDEVILGGGEFCHTASLMLRREAVLDLPDWFRTDAPIADHYLQIFGSLNGGALYINRNMSVYRIGHHESWSSAMDKTDSASVKSLIKNRENHTFKHVKSLNYMGRDIDDKHRKAIDRKISDRLFTLSILYLKNDMYQEFQKMVVRSNDACKSVSLSHSILYYLRSAPYILKIMIKLRKTITSSLSPV